MKHVVQAMSNKWWQSGEQNIQFIIINTSEPQYQNSVANEQANLKLDARQILVKDNIIAKH